jgi:hypothetical protein
MRLLFMNTLAIYIAATMLAACQPGDKKAAGPAGPAGPVTASTWPASLKVMGDGFPNPGDVCRRIGESPATVNYLDHTATLAGCHSAADAAKLGGRIVGTVDGVTLVSIPTDAAQLGQ